MLFTVETDCNRISHFPNATEFQRSGYCTQRTIWTHSTSLPARRSTYRRPWSHHQRGRSRCDHLSATAPSSDRRSLSRRGRLGGRARGRARGRSISPAIPATAPLTTGCRRRCCPRPIPRLTRSRRSSLAGDLDDYQFPYGDGAWATVTRSYHQHGTGRIDFDLGGSAEVTAAKDGVIVYADDQHRANAYASAAWWYWNTVIIQHGDHEFSLYGHLAPGSIPQWIKDGCPPT